MKINRGFTLLEMVVAVGIFGLVGLIAAHLLSQSIDVTGKVLSRGERLTEIQRAIQILEWDLRQLTHRGVRDEFGDHMAPLALNAGSVQFTRRGWINATDEQRSSLQRVHYYVNEGNLMRRFWVRLDRAANTPYVDQVLLRGIRSLSFAVVDSDLHIRSDWPNPFPDPDGETTRAIAVTLSLSIDADKEFTLGWAIPEIPIIASTDESDQERPGK